MTTEDDRQRLLRTAREAIVAHVTGAPAPPSDSSASTLESSGVFVTVHVNGSLRGCIGNLGPSHPLARVVRECAVAACSTDPRFEPVAPAELAAMDIEISLLGPLEPVISPDAIVIGRDGLVAELGGKRGLLLPQVAPEWNWDRETFFSQTCHKAGLAPDAWKRDAKMYRFEAEVFGEGGEGR